MEKIEIGCIIFWALFVTAFALPAYMLISGNYWLSDLQWSYQLDNYSQVVTNSATGPLPLPLPLDIP